MFHRPIDLIYIYYLLHLLISNMIIGEHMEYLSSDSVDKSEIVESCHFSSSTTEFLNSLTTSGMPSH